VSATLGAVREAVAARGLRVRRAWPRSSSHLLLDLAGVDGSVAGQWFDSPDQAAQVAAATPGAQLLPRGNEPARLVLQPAGADRKLKALAKLLTQPAIKLISHRPERRAVMHRSGRSPGYLKLVPPKRLATLASQSERAERLPLHTARVLEVDETLCAVVTAPLPGRPLTEWLPGPSAAEGCCQVGRTLAAVHAASPTGLTPHGAADELAVTERWENWALGWGVGPPPCNQDLQAPPAPNRAVLVHRDFHDGQVLLDESCGVGLIDFDLMAAGDPAVDVANFICHLELREHQWGVAAAPLVAAFLDGYQPSRAVQQALPFYLATSHRRLTAVYAFRDVDPVSFLCARRNEEEKAFGAGRPADSQQR
jgi:Phosphotransferase enzyme family